jgi:hypothetical protein
MSIHSKWKAAASGAGPAPPPAVEEVDPHSSLNVKEFHPLDLVRRQPRYCRNYEA